jgi:hypothetical protein
MVWHSYLIQEDTEFKHGDRPYFSITSMVKHPQINYLYTYCNIHVNPYNLAPWNLRTFNRGVRTARSTDYLQVKGRGRGGLFKTVDISKNLKRDGGEYITVSRKAEEDPTTLLHGEVIYNLKWKSLAIAS